MIKSFIQDLNEGSKTYQYHLFKHNDGQISDIPNQLLSTVNNYTSHYLKLRMFDLFEGENSQVFFTDMLSRASHHKSSELMLEILKKSITYQPHDSDSLFYIVRKHYKNLLSFKQLSKHTIENSFICHIKNSQITLTPNELIEAYIDIFSSSNINFFLNAFHIEREKVCMELNPHAYSQMTLSSQTLSLAKISLIDTQSIIGHVNSLSKKKKNFPLILVSGLKNNNLQILFANEANNEQKITHLFEELVNQQYNYHIDKDKSFAVLISLIDSINERCHLDHVIIQAKEKKVKLKI
jgi:hypothetical protein